MKNFKILALLLISTVSGSLFGMEIEKSAEKPTITGIFTLNDDESVYYAGSAYYLKNFGLQRAKIAAPIIPVSINVWQGGDEYELYSDAESYEGRHAANLNKYNVDGIVWSNLIDDTEKGKIKIRKIVIQEYPEFTLRLTLGTRKDCCDQFKEMVNREFTKVQKRRGVCLVGSENVRKIAMDTNAFDADKIKLKKDDGFAEENDLILYSTKNNFWLLGLFEVPCKVEVQVVNVNSIATVGEIVLPDDLDLHDIAGNISFVPIFIENGERSEGQEISVDGFLNKIENNQWQASTGRMYYVSKEVQDRLVQACDKELQNRLRATREKEEPIVLEKKDTTVKVDLELFEILPFIKNDECWVKVKRIPIIGSSKQELEEEFLVSLIQGKIDRKEALELKDGQFVILSDKFKSDFAKAVERGKYLKSIEPQVVKSNGYIELAKEDPISRDEKGKWCIAVNYFDNDGKLLYTAQKPYAFVVDYALPGAVKQGTATNGRTGMFSVTEKFAEELRSAIWKTNTKEALIFGTKACLGIAGFVGTAYLIYCKSPQYGQGFMKYLSSFKYYLPGFRS